MSYTLEAGIIFHSIFIGISYGASADMGVVRVRSLHLRQPLGPIVCLAISRCMLTTEWTCSQYA